MMKLFKLSLMEIKKQSKIFILFSIITMLFFTSIFFLINYNNTTNKNGISGLIDDCNVEILNFKDKDYLFNDYYLYFEPKYDEIIYAEDNSLLLDSVCIYNNSKSNINLDNNKFEIAINGYEIGSIIKILYNGTLVEAYVKYNNVERTILSYKFCELSYTDSITIKFNKEDSYKIIDLYNKTKDDFNNESIIKNIKFISLINILTTLLVIIMLILLCFALLSFINIIVDSNRKHIAIKMAIGYTKKDVFLIYYFLSILVIVISFFVSLILSQIIISVYNSYNSIPISKGIGFWLIVLALSFLFDFILMLLKYNRIFNISISKEIKEV